LSLLLSPFGISFGNTNRDRRLTMKKLIPAVSGGPDVDAGEGTSRREFLQGGAGAAAGAAVILATPKVASIALDAPGHAAAGDPKAVVTKPSGPAPKEPVTAYVRDARRGEVTVMSGQRETTYTDPVLVKRLLDAAR
jgi:TAT (twin-arginine translocation) pathway signal sequence